MFKLSLANIIHAYPSSSTVYLYGNYIGKPQVASYLSDLNNKCRNIDQNTNQPPYDSDMDSDMSDEGAYNLDDVSSDVEVHPDELQGLEDDSE